MQTNDHVLFERVWQVFRLSETEEHRTGTALPEEDELILAARAAPRFGAL